MDSVLLDLNQSENDRIVDRACKDVVEHHALIPLGIQRRPELRSNEEKKLNQKQNSISAARYVQILSSMKLKPSLEKNKLAIQAS